MTIKATLTDKECFVLAAQVTSTVAGAHINVTQAIEVLCSALAMVVGDVDELSIDDIGRASETIAVKVVEYARLYREHGLGLAHDAPLQ